MSVFTLHLPRTTLGKDFIDAFQSQFVDTHVVDLEERIMANKERDTIEIEIERDDADISSVPSEKTTISQFPHSNTLQIPDSTDIDSIEVVLDNENPKKSNHDMDPIMLSYATLRQMCKVNNIKASGKKADLMRRLKEADLISDSVDSN